MSEQIDSLFCEDPIKWVQELPDYQRTSIEFLMSTGLDFENIAQRWATASATNTFRFSASTPVGNKGAFIENIKTEIRAFLCGDKKYKKERDGLFGDKGVARIYVVSALAVAIAPHIGVAAPVIAPLVALILAGFGKITLNAWCNTQPSSTPPPSTP